MAEGFAAGRVSVPIIPSFKDFLRNLSSEATKASSTAAKAASTAYSQSFKPKLESPKVDLDTSAATASAAQLKLQVDEMKQTTLNIDADTAQVNAKFKVLKLELAKAVKLNMDDTDAKTKVIGLKTAIKSLGDTKAEINVDSALARANLKTLQAQLAAIDKDVEVDVRVDTKGGGGGVGFDWGAVMGAYKIPAVVTALSLLSTATAAVGAAAVGAAASAAPLVGLYAAYPAVMLAAKQATGTVTLAMEGLAEAVEILNDPDAKPKEVAEAMQALTPAARDLARSVADLVAGPLKDLKASLQEAIAPGFTRAIENLTPLFPIFEKQLSGTAKVIGRLATEASRTMSTPFFKGELARIMETNNKVIENGGRAGIDLAAALLRIVDVFRPVLVSMSEYAVRGAEFIRATVKAGAESGRLGDFFQRSWDLAKDFGSVIADLAVGLFNVGSQSQRMGKFLGTGIAEGAAAFRAWTESVTGQNSIREYFADSIPIVQEVVRLVGSAISGFSSLAANPSIVPLLQQIREQLLPAMIDLANGVTTAFGPALVSAATAFVRFHNALSFSPLAAVLQTLADSVIWIANAVAKAPAPLNSFLSSLLALSLGLKVVTFAGGGVVRMFTPMVVGWNLVATATGRATVAARLNVVATKLQVFWSKASAAASKVMAAGIWLVNAAMRANPIGILVTALIALGAGLVLAYKKSETFRKIVDAAWAAIKKAAVVAWDGIKKVLGALIGFITKDVPKAWKWLTDKVSDAWNAITRFVKAGLDAVVNFVKNWTAIGLLIKHWDTLRDATERVWEWLREKIGAVIGAVRTVVSAGASFVRDRLVAAWTSVREKTEEVWNSIRTKIADTWSAVKSTLSAVGGFLKDKVVGAFTFAVNAIKSIWTKLIDIARVPVNFFIETVYNKGIVPTFNAIAEFLPGVGTLSTLPGIQGQLTNMGTETSPGPGDVSGGPRAAAGGVLPGFTPGRDVHHFFSPTAGGLHLSGGESIMVPEWTRGVGGEAAVKRKNELARHGIMDGDGFAGGGIYRPVKGGSPGSLHGSPPAVDLAIPTGSPVAAIAAGRVSESYDIAGPLASDTYNGTGPYGSYGRVIEIVHQGFSSLSAHLQQRGVRAGQQVQGGQIIGLSDNTGNSSGPHLHFGVSGRSPYDFMSASTNYSGGGSSLPNISGGGGGSFLDPLVEAVQAQVANLLDKVRGYIKSGLGTPDPMTSAFAGVGTAAVAELQSLLGGIQSSSTSGSASSAVSAGSGAAGIWKSLMSTGFFTGKQAAGVMGNMQAESSLNPFIIQGGGTSTNPADAGSAGYGLVQWTPGTKLLGYMNAPATVAKEVDALVSQLQGRGPSPEGSAGASLRATNSVANAARVFEVEYERPASTADVGTRIGYAENFFAQFGGKKMDGGGWLKPGRSVLNNMTGAPEAVLSRLQSKAFVEMAEALVRLAKPSAGQQSVQPRQRPAAGRWMYDPSSPNYDPDVVGGHGNAGGRGQRGRPVRIELDAGGRKTLTGIMHGVAESEIAEAQGHHSTIRGMG